MDCFLQITIIISAGLLTVFIGLRCLHMLVEHSRSWLTASALLLLMSHVPSLCDHAALWMGFTPSPLTIVLIAVFVLLVGFYRHSRTGCEPKDASMAFTQRLAILACQVHSRYARQVAC